MMERPIKSLSELMDGGVEERFNHALDEVWDNVFDPNTKPDAPREIVMKVKIKASMNRDSARFDVDIVPKLAPPVPLSQTVMLSLGGDGSIVATERTNQVPGQIGMDGSEQPLPKVMEFKKAADKAAEQ